MTITEQNITTYFSLNADKLPGGVPMRPEIPYDPHICSFYGNYRGWILNYAETFINGRGVIHAEPGFVGDAGFAFLALVNGYFDIIGQLSGSDGDEYDCYRQWNGGKNAFEKAADPNRNWAKWDNPPDDKQDYKPIVSRRIAYGLTRVFYTAIKGSGIDPKTDDGWAKFCHCYVQYARHPIAHTMLPTQVFITRENVPNGLFKFEDKDIVQINLLSWYDGISRSFDEYCFRIRFPQNHDDALLRERFILRFNKLAET